MIVRTGIATLFLVVASVLPAQNISFTASVGTGQAVPSPGGGAPVGLADLSGAWWNAAGQRLLYFNLHYIPTTWITSGYTGENVIFLFEPGSAALPGTPRLGGTLYIPLPYNPGVIIARRGQVVWNGPGDTVPPTSQGGSGVPCPPALGANCNHGGSWGQTLNLTGVPLGTNFTCQGFLLDGPAGRLYSSNALNMTVVP